MPFSAVVFDTYPWGQRSDGLFYVGVDKPISVRLTDDGNRIIDNTGVKLPTTGLFTEMTFRSIAQHFGSVVGMLNPYAKNALYIPKTYKSSV